MQTTDNKYGTDTLTTLTKMPKPHEIPNGKYLYEMASGNRAFYIVAQRMDLKAAKCKAQEWLKDLPAGGVYQMNCFKPHPTEPNGYLIVMTLTAYPKVALMRETANNGKRFYYVDGGRVSADMFRNVCAVLPKHGCRRQNTDKKGKETTVFVASR